MEWLPSGQPTVTPVIPMMKPVSFFLPIALMAGTVSTGQAREPDEQAEIAAKAGCSTVPACLSVMTRRHVPAETRYWAKRFLDAHPTPEVVAAIAPLLDSDLEKLRAAAWWFVRSHEQVWKPHLHQLLAALVKSPHEAYLVADIGGIDAWEPLLELASTSRDPAQFANVLRRIDAAKALELGFDAIESPQPGIADTDGFVRGIFNEHYASPRYEQSRARLEAIIAGNGPTRSRQLAIVALEVAQSSLEDVPQVVVDAYADAPAELKRQIRDSYGQDASPAADQVADLASPLIPDASDPLAQDTRQALSIATQLAPYSASLSPQIQALLSADDGIVRIYAADALFHIDRRTWRRLLPDIAKDPDVVQAAEAYALANRDTRQSKRAFDRHVKQHWYPGMADLAVAISTIRAREEAKFSGQTNASSGEDEAPVLDIIFDSYSIYAEPYVSLCADAAEGQRQPGSLWHDEGELVAASTYADVDTWHLSAALEHDGGWWVGHDEGEFGGLISFTPDDQARVDVMRTSAEPLVIFPWKGRTYVVAGGASVPDRGQYAELLQISRNGSGMAVRGLMNLPAAPTDVIVRDGRLLMQLKANGWVDLSDPNEPRWIGCLLK